MKSMIFRLGLSFVLFCVAYAPVFAYTPEEILDLGRRTGDTQLKKHLKERPKGIKVIQLYYTSVTDEGMHAIGDYPGIEELILIGKPAKLSDVGFRHLSKLRKLRRLKLRLGRLSYKTLKAIGDIGSLEDLSTEFPVDDTSAADIGRLTRLRHLDTDMFGVSYKSGELTEKGIAHLSKLPQLETLYLSRFHGGKKALEMLGSFGKLKKLTLMIDSADASCATLGSEAFTQLEYLSLEGGKKIYTKESMYALARLPRLHTLVFPDAPDESFGALISSKSLRHLSIPSGRQITDRGLAHISRIRGLTSLELRPDSGKGITDAGLRSISKMYNLRKLSLYLPLRKRLTKQGFISLKELPLLQVLDLRENWGLADDSVLAAISEIRTLERINLDETEMSFAGLLKYLPKLSRLTHLGIKKLGETGIDDRIVPVLLSLKRLKYVDLRMSELSDEGFRKLSTHPTLVGIAFGNFLPRPIKLSQKALEYIHSFKKLRFVFMPYGNIVRQMPEYKAFKKKNDARELNQRVQVGFWRQQGGTLYTESEVSRLNRRVFQATFDTAVDAKIPFYRGTLYTGGPYGGLKLGIYRIFQGRTYDRLGRAKNHFHLWQLDKDGWKEFANKPVSPSPKSTVRGTLYPPGPHYNLKRGLYRIYQPYQSHFDYWLLTEEGWRRTNYK